MKKFWIQVSILVAIILGALYFSQNQADLGGVIPIATPLSSEKVQIGNTEISVDVADTTAKRTKGLGDRDSLAADSGMLFIFDQSKKYQFWMKGMRFPLDFIFISQGRVVDLLRNVTPPTAGQKDSELPIYQPLVPIDMMVEVNAGFVDNHQIRVGDQVYLIQPTP